MKHNNKFIYPKIIRESINGLRHYDINKQKLPSVTTIISETQSPQKTASLNAWRQRVGVKKAALITKESSDRGTAMHDILEKYIKDSGSLDLNKVGEKPHNMAIRVIEQGLCNVSEYFGLECALYYPGLYAGATDAVGMHKGEMAIIDFKQTNKPKERAWIEDYCLQLAAYGMAHDYVYKTAINKGVIMMCSQDNYYQEFIIEGKEYKNYKHQWLRRVSDYYERKKSGLGYRTI